MTLRLDIFLQVLSEVRIRFDYCLQITGCIITYIHEAVGYLIEMCRHRADSQPRVFSCES